MPEQSPKIMRIALHEATQDLAALVDEVLRGQTRVVIDEAGRPAAVMVSPEAYALLVRVEERFAERRRVLEGMRASFRDVPDEEIEREVARAVAESRAEARAERERETLLSRQ
jgi:prevent-host-death family protein